MKSCDKSTQTFSVSFTCPLRAELPGSVGRTGAASHFSPKECLLSAFSHTVKNTWREACLASNRAAASRSVELFILFYFF